MEKREKLIINVDKWLHREGGIGSYLLRAEDGKRCCLGIYLEDNCGIKSDLLRQTAAPDLLPNAILATLPEWLSVHRNNTALAEAMMAANDEDETSEEEVRKNIRELFLRADIEVIYCEKTEN